MTLGICSCGGDLKLQIRYQPTYSIDRETPREFWMVCEDCRVEIKGKPI